MAEFGKSHAFLKAMPGVLLTLCVLLLLMTVVFPILSPVRATGVSDNTHLGVASCAGSTCHGRLEADGAVVRQDEVLRWQEPSSPAGKHSQAYSVLLGKRSGQIARNLGIGKASSAPMCLGCHADPVASRGNSFQLADGVGCESCHGGASNWIASHYAVGASHANNVARGLAPLENPKVRAGVCLDCHFGSAAQGQFVNHRIMAAGHPRISFELDLFSSLQQHHDEDADYVARKRRTDNVQLWAVGQALALKRSLDLYASASRGTEGAFPEFYFFDCHSCHRRIYDQADAVKTGVRNPGRPIPEGMPPYNDENMIMLSAAARITAPASAGQFDKASKDFHAALALDRSSAIAAARRLSIAADNLANNFASGSFGSGQTFAIIDIIATDAIAARLTDYEGSVQAVMAVDTLLSALVRSGNITQGAAAGIRANVNRAYGAVRDPNDYRPSEFRSAIGAAASAVRSLR
ncbi:multiheme c-type cytochrome [Sphingorhabdus sp.]|uniref:multiheme c-type cytochrome n=1 Tax=Sphingorhabdus sp. TaxID=1902408 RepID=UPI0038FCABE5